ncbi:DUF86 domain-containing protein [Pseudarthrobacter sp. AL07]|uniref:HepT-like ribonuclease domain-containing protein n=1 Tax=unclassified Pseudarthrobacter TaxID=2647000 RepID=UPI00249B1521|nr:MULTISPECIES: HepT-like ribonuclease domain-containing protein [unclassified Pseudarthrobacter]MDI3196192.1 DUF86 domain-containing protein [Pseudarthrobacter sp. AL20]MDI3210263.1 DUF86 domain-containing protein [Pseudarthrobacter sp. AL07]
MSGDPEGVPGGGPFVPREQKDPTFSLAAAPRDRVLQLIGDMEERLGWAQQIVGEGELAFNDPDNWRSREAMKSIFIDLNTAADRIPEPVREQYPAIPWRQMRGLRNVLSHDYAAIRNDTVWQTAARSLPELGAQLAHMRAEIERWP